MSKENKPCQLCGGENLLPVRDSLTGLWAIACKTCFIFYGVSNTEDKAWEKWNKRSEAEKDAMIDWLSQKLGQRCVMEK